MLKKLTPKQRSKALLMSDLYDVHMDDIQTSSEELPYVRKTISIAPQINKWIQDYRSNFMKMNLATEQDYTTVSNYLMAYGLNFIQQYEVTAKDAEFVNNVIGDRLRLGEHSLADSWENIHREIEKQQAEREQADESETPVKAKRKIVESN
jgi:hypothetical protein